MNKKKLFMLIGATIVVLFIVWFYIEQLGLRETLSEEKTIVTQIENTEINNNSISAEEKDLI